MITITDSAEIERRIEELVPGSRAQVIDGGGGFAVAYRSAPVAWDRIHAPPPSSARWEGPPPRRARR